MEAYKHHLIRTSIGLLLDLDPTERLYQLGRLVAFHRVSAEELWRFLPHEHWPVAFLRAGGRLDVTEWGQAPSDVLYSGPEFSGEYHRLGWNLWVTKREYEGPLVHWAGEACIAAPEAHWAEGRTGSGESHATLEALRLWNPPVEASYSPSSVRFLCPPWNGDPPLMQTVWVPLESGRSDAEGEEVLNKSVEDPSTLGGFEQEVLWEELARYNLPRITMFAPPFERYFGFGWSVLNLNHRLTQELVRIGAALELSRRHQAVSGGKLGELQDALQEACYTHRGYRGLRGYVYRGLERERFRDSLQFLASLVRSLEPLGLADIEELRVDFEEFVPGTIRSFGPTKEGITVGHSPAISEAVANGSFGKALTG
jgi:hypothetical protein